MKCPEPGIYPDTPDNDYFAWEAASQSFLKVVRKGTPREAYHYLHKPPMETDAMQLGSALHLAMLQPHLWDEQVVEGLDCDRRSKANKLKHEIFANENVGKIILRPAELAQVRNMQERIEASPAAVELMEAPGHTEVALVWDDEETGLRCKAKLDRLCRWRGHNIIFDWKTTSGGLDDQSIERAIGNFGYDVQSAFYLDGASALSEADRKFLIGFVKVPPKSDPGGYSDVRLVEPNPTCLYEGRYKYQKALRQWAKCTEAGEFPGYGNEIFYAGLPKWDQVSEYEENNEF